MDRPSRIRTHLAAATAGVWLLAWLPASAGAQALTVTATVLSKSNCKFSGAAASSLDFGSVNPASGSDAVATATRTFTCAGSANTATYLVTAGDGLWSTGVGARRMRHATDTTQYLAYSLSVSPSTGNIAKNATGTLTITGRITPSQFANAVAGSYSDTVVITLSP